MGGQESFKSKEKKNWVRGGEKIKFQKRKIKPEIKGKKKTGKGMGRK